jgi:hypothetical protein
MDDFHSDQKQVSVSVIIDTGTGTNLQEAFTRVSDELVSNVSDLDSLIPGPDPAF